MNTFLHSAQKVLSKSAVPLHYREITSRALQLGILQTSGLTPWASMNAQLSIDIRNENSLFYRSEPGFYGLKKSESVNTRETLKSPIPNAIINKELNSKQKGDIGEARIAELITLYGSEGLSCYKPISDDEGIDIIAKRRGKLDVVYIQVKTSYGYKERGFVATVKEKNILNKSRMLLVFAYFDLSEGDLFDQVFCIPAPDFLKLTQNDKKVTSDRVFTVGLSNPDKSKYSAYMIEKRELANRIVEIMDRL